MKIYYTHTLALSQTSISCKYDLVCGAERILQFLN